MPRGGVFGWLLMIILIGGLLYGGYHVYQTREAERKEQVQKHRESQEKKRLARIEQEKQNRERRQAELDRRKKAAEEEADRIKREDQERRQAEEARRKADQAKQDEEARRRAEEDEIERRRRELEDAQQPDEPGEPEEVDDGYPKPFPVELPDLSVYCPESKDVIPMDADQQLGTWSWELAPKYDDITDFPTNESKWTDRNKAGKMAATYRQWREQGGRIKASPSAKDFPGVPEDEAPLVARTVTIDSSIGGWHSTGLYAPPGAEITFSFSGSASKDGVSVRIGCHTDDLMHEKTETWTRLPIMGNTASVDKTRVNLADPCGGLVYVCVNNANKHARTFKVKISGATPAPLYTMGETTPEDWKEQLETTKAPWGEIRTPRLVFTMPVERLKECEKIKEVAELLQKCMALQDWVAGWDEFPQRIKNPMRFVVDRQISIGYGHSGYPAMGSLDWANSLATGSILTQGDWGLWHELGHNHQGNPVAMEGQTEVSVNIFSMLCQWWGVGMDPRSARGTSHSEIAPHIHNYLADKTLKYNDAENGVQLFLWGELMYHFGPEPFRQAHLSYHKRPYDGGKESDDGKWNWIMKSFSRTLEKDFSLYFETWKLPMSKGTKSQMKKYPLWKPSEKYPSPDYLQIKIGS